MNSDQSGILIIAAGVFVAAAVFLLARQFATGRRAFMVALVAGITTGTLGQGLHHIYLDGELRQIRRELERNGDLVGEVHGPGGGH